MNLPHAQIVLCSDRAALVQRAADLARGAGRRALAERGRYAVATCRRACEAA